MAAKSGGARSFLIFRAADYTCAIPSGQIVQLVLMPELVRVAGQPALLEGFFNLRGTVVPVVTFHRLFQKAVPVPQVHTPLIVIFAPGGLLALRVDSVDEIAVVEESSISESSSQDSLNQCARGQFRRGEEQVVVLAPERLLLAKERMCIADLELLARERLDSLEAQAS